MLYTLSNPLGRGVSGFQVTGMMEGFFIGLKFSISGFFEVGKFCQLFFGIAWFKLGFFSGFKAIWRFLIVPPHPGRIVPRINFYGTEIRHRIFWGSNFGPGSFLGFVWSPRDFFGFWFDHPCHLKSGVAPWVSNTLLNDSDVNCASLGFFFSFLFFLFETISVFTRIYHS